MLPINITFLSERLNFRSVSLEDIPFILDASRYNGFCDGMHWEQPESPDELVDIYESNRKSWEDSVAYVFTLELLEELTPVGRICIRLVEGSIWDFGFWTHPKHFGKGYMTEAVGRLMDFGFTNLNISEFQASYAVWNTASQRVLEKNGFQFLRHDTNAYL